MQWRLLIVLVVDAVLAAIGWNGYVAGSWSPNRWGLLLSAMFGVWIVVPELLRGEDGKPSTSKLQFFLWTTAFAYSVGAFLALKWGPLAVTINPALPTSLYAAMGMATTLIGAKGITIHNMKSGLLSTKGGPSSTKCASPLYFLTDDNEQVQLTKVQLLFWTLVAITAYLRAVLSIVAAAEPGTTVHLPDIDPMLVSLVGIGQATYLGRKLLDR
ncbi:MAG: hypothetical protein AB7Q00_08045 [Phycisphaerales bacterium]